MHSLSEIDPAGIGKVMECVYLKYSTINHADAHFMLTRHLQDYQSCCSRTIRSKQERSARHVRPLHLPRPQSRSQKRNFTSKPPIPTRLSRLFNNFHPEMRAQRQPARPLGTMLYLIASPTPCEGLRAEIDTAIRSHSISSLILETEAKSLPHLRACIKEGMRL
jgi:hypothetical protein